jgi:hypothetical protein
VLSRPPSPEINACSNHVKLHDDVLVEWSKVRIQLVLQAEQISPVRCDEDAAIRDQSTHEGTDFLTD